MDKRVILNKKFPFCQNDFERRGRVEGVVYDDSNPHTTRRADFQQRAEVVEPEVLLSNVREMGSFIPFP
ncbi:hypothetical protein NEPTK9_001120 [Candidatus Neptunochlamydia vexilliferae]|uniref:Uncharacterized protein n=1 Tax=Candidatus Neptunichlamydia vexilliferae TaxID=1651774 RepID=A0ABS0B081_9BACT|nr:hypothetical protein [Candidatus Neptunochlamydia vexilliferae]